MCVMGTGSVILGLGVRYEDWVCDMRIGCAI